MCILLEGGPTGELGLDPTGIADLQDSVPLPLFLSDLTELDHKTDDDLFIEYHFLAQITMRTLLNRVRGFLGTFLNPSEDDQPVDAPPEAIIKELVVQLNTWREHLPAVMAWDLEEIDTAILEFHQYRYFTSVNATPRMSRMPDPKLVLIAALRTRYKYAEYLIWRPYIYRALHLPGPMDDLGRDHFRKALNGSPHRGGN